jgi:hypothetical protein
MTGWCSPRAIRCTAQRSGSPSSLAFTAGKGPPRDGRSRRDEGPLRLACGALSRRRARPDSPARSARPGYRAGAGCRGREDRTAYRRHTSSGSTSRGAGGRPNKNRSSRPPRSADRASCVGLNLRKIVQSGLAERSALREAVPRRALVPAATTAGCRSDERAEAAVLRSVGWRLNRVSRHA